MDETTWKFRYGEAQLAAQAPRTIHVSCPESPIEALCLRWNQAVPQETRLLGDAWERAYGDMEWRGIAPERVMPWYFLAYDSRSTYACGVKTGAAALCSWQVDAQGVSLLLDLRCGGLGVQLGERRLEAATLVERAGPEGETPFAAARAFMPLLCDHPLVTPTPAYGANDYYYAYCISTQETLLRDSVTIAELSPDTDNRPYSVVDAGWQFGGLANGSPWHVSNARFPDMAKLAADIKAAGSRPGIWFRPLLTNESLPAAWTLPNARFPVAREPGLILDPSLPEALERIAGDVAVFRKWGYELIKHDYTTFDLFGRWGKDMSSEITPPGWSFYDRSRTTAEIVRGLYEKIYEAAGDMVIIGCNTFGHLAA